MNGSMTTIRNFGAELSKRSLSHVSCVIAPPYPYLLFVDGRLTGTGIALAGQDCSAKGDKGAVTGDVSAAMLQDVGCQYVILGHSERRQLYQESNALIAEKIRCALAVDLIPVLCVGETLAQKEAGQTAAVVFNQLQECIGEAKSLVVAYEPVWSIGTGHTPTNEEIVSTCQQIQAFGTENKISLQVLYGGSVNHHNAHEILHLPGVDGVLVGGASLNSETFWPILEAA